MTVPPWGCPWHGLVLNSELQRPGLPPLFWPGWDVTFGYQRSTSSLIRVPGVEPVERTEDEAAADAASGRQWWAEALIAGGALHRKTLGRNAWIYLDPENNPWLVRIVFTPEPGLPATAEMKLIRFGVLGGAPAEYSYSVDMPDLGQGSNTPAVTAAALHHSRHDGRAAMFALGHVRTPSAGESGYYPWAFPMGFFEIEISGPADDADFAVTVHRTRAQTIAAPVHEPAQLVETHYRQVTSTSSEHAGGAYPDCSGTITLTQTPSVVEIPAEDAEPGDVAIEVGSGNGSVEHPGYIVSLYYDEAGDVHEMSAHMGMEYSVTSAPPSITVHQPFEQVYQAVNNDGAEACQIGSLLSTAGLSATIERESVFDCSATLTLRIDGVDTVKRDVSIRHEAWAAAGTGYIWPPEFGPGDYPFRSELTWSDGSELAIGNRSVVPDPEWVPRYITDVTVPAVVGEFETIGMLANPILFQPILQPEPTQITSRHCYAFTQHSAHMFGIAGWSAGRSVTFPISAYADYSFQAEVITPDGARSAAHPPVGSFTGVSGRPVLYGAWCPVTGAVTRSGLPVVYV